MPADPRSGGGLLGSETVASAVRTEGTWCSVADLSAAGVLVALALILLVVAARLEKL